MRQKKSWKIVHNAILCGKKSLMGRWCILQKDKLLQLPLADGDRLSEVEFGCDAHQHGQELSWPVSVHRALSPNTFPAA